MRKMALANDVYMTHLQNFGQEDPKERSQKFLYQFNEIGHQLHREFDIVAERLKLPFEQPLMTYPSLGNLMDIIQQEDMEDKNQEYFQEMANEVKVKDKIAQKVLNNRLTVVKTPQEKDRAYSQYNEYRKESKRLLNFYGKMIEKREKGTTPLELEQPEGVPKVKEISKEELDEKFKEIIGPPQHVEPIGKNTLPPHYSREISRYEPPKPVKDKEKEELIEKVKEMTNERMKGDKREKSIEVDTDLSWDHEGLKPIPKVPKGKIDESPKPPRIPRMLGTKTNAGQASKGGYPTKEREIGEGNYPEVSPKISKNKENLPRVKQDPSMGTGDKKPNEKLDLEKPSNLVDEKTARWIEEQNEFMGKQREQKTDGERKEREMPTFSSSNPIKVLQRPKSIHPTNYERLPQHLMEAQRGQTSQLPMIPTNQRNGSWVNQGKRYLPKERVKNQRGGYGKQYGTNSEKRGHQTYGTGGNQSQGHVSAYGSQRRRAYHPTQGFGSGQGGDGGNGDENDKKGY